MNLNDMNPGKIALLGDIHSNTRYLKRALSYAKENGVGTVVQLGDAGVYGNFLTTLSDMMTNEFPDMMFFFIDGNHEDFNILYDYPIDENGVRWICDNVAHLPRGFSWKWSGKSFVAIGGAISVDRDRREPYISWDPRERLSAEDVLTVMASQYGMNADYVLAHDAPAEAWIPGLPTGVFPEVALADANYHREHFVSFLGHYLTPSNWYHGHYHIDYTDVIEWKGGNKCFVRGLGCDGMPLIDSMVFVDLTDGNESW